MLRNVELGQLLREKRQEKGWSTETAAEVYGNFLYEHPITEGHIWKIEEGNIPMHLTRRAVLATMYGIAPAVLLGDEISPGRSKKIAKKFVYVAFKRQQAVNIEEYQHTLHAYWTQGYSKGVLPAVEDMMRRIAALHDTVNYTSADKKQHMKKLLCGYHLRLATVAKEQGLDKYALEHIKDAILLAHEEHFPDYEARARYHRGEFYLDHGQLPLALRDFRQVQQLSAPATVKGWILMEQGLTQARFAQTEKEKQEALRLFDASEMAFEQSSLADQALYQMDTSKWWLYLERAYALVGPPVNQLRSPGQAQETLDEALKQPPLLTGERHKANRQLDTTIVTAQINLAQGWYPIAVTQAQEALTIMGNMNMVPYRHEITRILEEVQTTSYRNSIDVAQLRLQLFKLQHPELFSKQK